MKRHFKLPPSIAIPALFLLCAPVLIALGVGRKTIEVDYTDRGFVPQKVLINVGDTIRFVNETSSPIWPASDFHPTHLLYPEFDPKGPIAPGSSWSFTFERAGVWTYHNHLEPEVTGTVIAQGAPGETTAQCLTRYAGSSGVTPQCWEGEITDALTHGGLSAAFDLFKKLYYTEPAFPQNCHDVMHVLGAEAYHLYATEGSVFSRPETAYCGYGFYHGFIEAMLVAQGPGQYAQVRQYCEDLRTSSTTLSASSGPCFHGIGHALFDSVPGEYWGSAPTMVSYALGQCEVALAKEDERVQCSTGVYNSLAIAMSSRNYNLAFTGTSTLALCAAQKSDYQDGCYREVGIGVIRDLKLDRDAGLTFIRSFPEPARSSLVLAYSGDEAVREITTLDPKSFAALCDGFSADENACMRGVIAGMRQVGKPGLEYQPMFPFCAALQQGEQAACWSFAVSQARAVAADPTAFKAACLAEASTSSLSATCEGK